MISSEQTIISYDMKNTDELIENEKINVSSSIDHPYLKENFLRKRYGSNIEPINQSISSDIIRQSALSSSMNSPQLKSIDWKQGISCNQSFILQNKQLSNSFDQLLNQILLLNNAQSFKEPSLINFMKELEITLTNISTDIKRVEKQNSLYQQQLQISIHALQQRENVIKIMREENLKMQTKLQQSQIELEQTKLRHERFTKQNNENFYKISKQIKDTINVKSQKQQNQIDYLKQIVNSPKHIQYLGQKNSASFQISQNSPYNILNSSKGHISQKDKIDGNFSTFTQQQYGKIFERKTSLIKSSQQVKINVESNENKQDSILNEVQSESQYGDSMDQEKNLYNDLPDESKFEEVRKFFIHSDLSDLKCNKGQRELNLAKKVKMQKAKLHTMFLLSNFMPKDKLKQPTTLTPLISPNNSSTKSFNKSLSNIKVDPLNISIAKLKNTQKLFNQNLTINYHHTKASSLAHQFFEFKEEKENDTQSPQPQNQTQGSPRQREKSLEVQPQVKSDFLQHSADYHFFSLLLDMSKSIIYQLIY